MEQYISKSVLVAEIEKLNPPLYPTLAEKMSYQDATKDCIDIIYAHKVEEVDLEKELIKWRHNHFHGRRDKEASGEYLKRVSQLDLAKHFFELGIQVSNKSQKEK